MYSGILTLILLFTILNMVVSRAIFSSSECKFKSFRRLMTVPCSSSLAVFYKSGSSPLYSYNIVAMLLSMWFPHAAGLFQTRTNEGDVGLTFNILWTGMKITSDETKGLVSLPDNVLYMWPYLGKPGLMKFALKSISTHFECVTMHWNGFQWFSTHLQRFPSNAGNCFQRFKMFFQRFRMFFQRCSMHWQCFQTFFLIDKISSWSSTQDAKNYH